MLRSFFFLVSSHLFSRCRHCCPRSVPHPSPTQLKDRETREFIYDFIQNHKVLDTMKSEQSGNNRKQRPPPVPIRNHHEQQQTQQVGSIVVGFMVTSY